MNVTKLLNINPITNKDIILVKKKTLWIYIVKVSLQCVFLTLIDIHIQPHKVHVKGEFDIHIQPQMTTVHFLCMLST